MVENEVLICMTEQKKFILCSLFSITTLSAPNPDCEVSSSWRGIWKILHLLSFKQTMYLFQELNKWLSRKNSFSMLRVPMVGVFSPAFKVENFQHFQKSLKELMVCSLCFWPKWVVSNFLMSMDMLKNFFGLKGCKINTLKNRPKYSQKLVRF